MYSSVAINGIDDTPPNGVVSSDVTGRRLVRSERWLLGDGGNQHRRNVVVAC